MISTVGIVVAILVAAALVWLLPKFQTRNLSRSDEDQRFLAENEARKTVAQIIGGIAILTGLYSTNATLQVSTEQTKVAMKQADLAQKQFNLAQAGQVTDRFTKATDQIGSPTMAVRLGGILALDRLSRDSKDDFWAIMNLLSTWVQAVAPWPPKAARVDSKAPPDVQAAIAVIAYRDGDNDSKEELLDLSDADLRGAYLVNATLDRIYITGTHLEGADLRGASFDGAHLKSAHFANAHVEGADLSHSDLDNVISVELDRAFGNADTTLPPGVSPPAQWQAH